MYIYAYIYACIYIYIYTHIYVCVYIHTCINRFPPLSLSIYICIDLSLYMHR